MYIFTWFGERTYMNKKKVTTQELRKLYTDAKKDMQRNIAAVSQSEERHFKGLRDSSSSLFGAFRQAFDNWSSMSSPEILHARGWLQELSRLKYDLEVAIKRQQEASL